MLTTYIGNNVGFVVHYALPGHWTAVAMNGLMSVQTIVAIFLDRMPRLRWAYYALIPVIPTNNYIRTNEWCRPPK